MFGELSERQIMEQIEAEKAKVESRPKTLDETKKWGAVSKVYNELTSDEMGMLNQAMIIYLNEWKLVKSDNVKGAARGTMKMLCKRLIEQMDKMSLVEKALVKEIADEKKAS
jgi:hypothetical protein